MRFARTCPAVAFAFSLLAWVGSARGDLQLFAAPPAPRLNYSAVVGAPAEGAAASALSYSLMFQSSGGDVLGVGLDWDRAAVVSYTSIDGQTVALADAYDPTPEELYGDVMLVGAHLTSVAEVEEAGLTMVRADFEHVAGGEVLIGDPYTNFYLHGTLAPSSASLPAGRLWGPAGSNVGRLQLSFVLDEPGQAPSDPASETGLVLPAGTMIFWDGQVELGSFLAGGEEYIWTFSPSLFEGDFGGYSTGTITWTSPVAEPTSLLLLIGGAATAGLGRLARGGRRR